MDDLLTRASAVNELLHRARRAAEQRESDIAHGRKAQPPSPLRTEDERAASALLLELCDRFAAGSEAERAVLREHVGGLPDVLLELNALPGQAAQALEDGGDPIWLSRGLAAAGLEDRAVDHRDTTVGLNALHRAADKVGLAVDDLWHLSHPSGE